MQKRSANKIRAKNSRDWSAFGLALEEKLGELLEPVAALETFSQLLKTQVPYDFLEVTILPEAFPEEATPANWVRNDTGLGDKLLSIILHEQFMSGLPRRKRPVIVRLNNSNEIVVNPELLRVMELHRGIMVPMVRGKRAYGVIKLFFQSQGRFDTETKQWLMISAGMLQRALHRSWMYQAAQKLATIDELTGLYNRRYFTEQLQKEFTRARRYHNSLSLILVDIDFFKDYNDNNGHLAGDRALRKVARTIRRSVREMDLVARWGGEEFALLLPQTEAKYGKVVAEKIRREVEIQRFKNERAQPSGNLTISLGVAENVTELKTHRELFNRADAALYRAKHEGRNRCASAEE